MTTMRILFGLLVVWIFAGAPGCSVSRQTGKVWTPDQKYPAARLQDDYRIFRSVLEESHPSLYWFTPKDSMDYYFDQGYRSIRDSMSETEFKNILSWVTNKIHCGHTSIRSSKKYLKYLDTAKVTIFPLTFRVWPDYAVLTANLHHHDSVLRRGTIITHIDGHPISQLTDTFLHYISSDGFSVNGRYQALSNRGIFGSLFQNLYGPKDQFTIGYLDKEGFERETVISAFVPKRDSLQKAAREESKKERDEPRPVVLSAARHMQIDTTLSSAYMMVNTFSRGNKLRPFFRKAFRVLDKHNIKHLVIDVRSNGGGDAGISTMLTRYLADKKFKLADSLYTTKRTSSYSKYIRWQPWYWVLMQGVTRKKKDGLYHFTYFENHYFKPKKKHHYDGEVYIITGGNSFSAATLFVKALKGQKNVTVIGEETGGGAYGNTAWMIPDVVLPHTKVRFRLPRFRLVMDKELVQQGRGVLPDIEVAPNLETIRRGIDPKVEAVRQIILRRSGLVQQ